MIEQFRSRPRPPATTGSPGALAAPGSSVTPAARQWLTDTLIAAVVTAASLAWTYSAGSWHATQGAANLAGYLLLAAGGAALIARRGYPVAVLAVTLAAALLAGSAGHAATVWLP